jgi:hypothetical protein
MSVEIGVVILRKERGVLLIFKVSMTATKGNIPTNVAFSECTAVTCLWERATLLRCSKLGYSSY